MLWIGQNVMDMTKNDTKIMAEKLISEILITNGFCAMAKQVKMIETWAGRRAMSIGISS